MKKLIAVLIFVSFILSVIPITTLAYDDDFHNSESTEIIMDDVIPQTKDYFLNINSNKTHYSLGENIVFSIVVDEEVEIENINYINNGISVVDISTSENNVIYVELQCTSEIIEGIFQLEILYTNEICNTANIYVVKNECGSFISSFSMENARDRYYKYAIENNILTEDEVTRLISQATNGTIDENVSVEIKTSSIAVAANTMSTTSDTAIYCGYLRWMDDKNDIHPLRKIKVEIYNSSGIIKTLLDDCCTNDEGYFEFTIPLETDTYVKVYAGDSNAIVKRNLIDIPYFYEFEEHIGKSVSTVTTLNAVFQMNTDLGKALQISQAVLTARDYAQAMMGYTPSNVVVVYPHDDEIEESYDSTNTNYCFYSSEFNRISITGRHPESHNFPHSYASWDVIMHEYGHHIQDEVQISGHIGGGHNSSLSMAEHYKNHYLTNTFNSCDIKCALFNTLNISSLLIPESQCKKSGTLVAWSEAWATVFGNMAQEYYSDYLSNIDGVSDKWYSSYNKVSYSLELTRTISKDNKKLMESVEGIIICLLYDLYDDSENNEAFDSISLGHETMWSLFTSSGAETLYDFIEHIKSMDYMQTHLSELGKLLNEYNLSTEAPTIHNFGFYCPTVEFIWNETNSNGYYNARKFRVNFYDYSYNYIGSSPEQIVRLDSNGKGYISIDADLWQSVLELDSTFYVSVTVGEYDGNVNNQGDGYFITKYESEFTKYDFSDLVQRIYYEESVSQILEGGDFYWYKFVAPMNGEYVFETTGSTDTCGELFTTLVIGTSVNNMIISNDDDGENNNFKIVYSLDKGEKVYLRVSGYSEESSGEYILSVTSPNHIHDYTYQYSNPSAIGHRASCCCGAFILEDHEYINKLGSLRCKHCSYTTNGPVVWNSLFDGNNNEIYCILNENEKGVLV